MTPLELPAELNDDDAAIRTLQTYFSPDYTLDKVRANARQAGTEDRCPRFSNGGGGGVTHPHY